MMQFPVLAFEQQRFQREGERAQRHSFEVAGFRASHLLLQQPAARPFSLHHLPLRVCSPSRTNEAKAKEKTSKKNASVHEPQEEKKGCDSFSFLPLVALGGTL